jgi:hypothetical protein
MVLSWFLCLTGETAAITAKYQNKASMMQSSKQQGFNLY